MGGIRLLVSRRENQAAHDRCVESLAKRLSLDGWMVEAHVPGWAKPAYIGEYIPDIRARKNDSTRIIEVETEDTLYSDADQQDTFRRYAAGTPGVVFLLYLARNDFTCVYLKE
jgi:hypothetical protein